MVRNEYDSREGVTKYVIDLGGSLDGCRFEVKHFPDNELEASLVDDDGGGSLATLTIRLGTRVSDTGEKMTVMKVVEEKDKPEILMWNSEDQATNEQKVSVKHDLLCLSAWWLAERGFQIPLKPDGMVMERARSMLGESKMDKYYGGEKVELHSGVKLQLALEGDLSGGFWRVEGVMEGRVKNQEDYVGWMDGSLHLLEDGTMRLMIRSWGSDWEEDDLRLDILALALRYLDNRFVMSRQFEVRYQDQTLDLPLDLLFEQTRFWLGF